MFYCNLKAEMVRRSISSKQMYEKLGIAERTFANKLMGKSEWTWSEVKKIREVFPDLPLDYLMTTTE